MKKRAIIALLLMICLLFSACSFSEQNTSSVESNTSTIPSSQTNTENESVSSTNSENETSGYHLLLHNSDLPLPDETLCYSAQEKAFTNMSEEEIQKVKDTIREWHIYMEWQFVDYNMREQLQSPNSPYWEKWEHTGAILYPGEENPVENEYDGAAIIAIIQELIDIAHDETFISDFKQMQEVIQSAVDNHAIDDLDMLHRLLHDCDYWLVNYPAHLETPPGDWDGVNVYFDCLNSLK